MIQTNDPQFRTIFRIKLTFLVSVLICLEELKLIMYIGIILAAHYY